MHHSHGKRCTNSESNDYLALESGGGALLGAALLPSSRYSSCLDLKLFRTHSCRRYEYAHFGAKTSMLDHTNA